MIACPSTSRMICAKITLAKQFKYYLQVAMLIDFCQMISALHVLLSLLLDFMNAYLLMFFIFNEAPQGNMLKSWLGSSSEKLKKQCSERTCFLGNSDDAGIGHFCFIISRCRFPSCSECIILMLLYMLT